MSVGTGASSQSAGVSRAPTSGLASSAGLAARAAASAADTRAETPAWSVALPVTEPVATPPSLPPWAATLTNEMTVTDTPCMTPFVVRVLLAQRRLALVWSRTIAMQSSAVDVATAWSTIDCGWRPRVIGVLLGVLTDRPPRGC